MVSPDSKVAAASPRAGAGGLRGRPVLVTGVPRSGTTWLARELAGARLAALPGREPMNPRSGQFALGGTLQSWTELDSPSPKQARILERCYRGREPRTFSRYGRKQWNALLPWSRTIVKDPFAMLSVPSIVRRTSAVPVVIYRHPGAVLASYRRMGWTADTGEIRRLQGRPSSPGPTDDASAMVEFWTFLHERVLAWLAVVPDAVVVSHAEASLGGVQAVHAVMRACGLRPPRLPSAVPYAADDRPAAASTVPDAGRLHGFARRPEEVADGWRSRLGAQEAVMVERETEQVWEALQGRRLPLHPAATS